MSLVGLNDQVSAELPMRFSSMAESYKAFRFVVVLFACTGLSAAAEAQEIQRDFGPGDAVFFWKPEWREKGDCGRLAVYSIAKLQGIDVSYQAIGVEISEEKGANLGAMERSLRKLDPEFRGLWVNPENFDFLSFPFIAHVRLSSKVDDGHWTVVVSYDKKTDTYLALNTTYGGIDKVSGAAFRSVCTGYVLGRTVSSNASRYIIFCVALFVVGVVFSLVLSRTMAFRRSVPWKSSKV